MATLKSESAGSRGDFARKVITGFSSACVATYVAGSLGLSFSGGDTQIEALLTFGVTAVFAYGVLNGLTTALFFVVSLVTAVFQFVTGLIEEITARLLTAIVESAAIGAIWLVSLPFKLMRMAVSSAYAFTLAPIVERKRQRDELRKLYEKVKAEYASYEEFVEDFKSGFQNSGKRKADEQHRAKQDHHRDPFKEACAVFGLSPDGMFTERDLKERYGAMIRAVHPDIVGPNALAAQVNQARDLIRKRKGW
jgi:hypothetical protein